MNREKIMDRIRGGTRHHEYSSEAVNGFLDFAQAIDLVLKTITDEEQNQESDSEPDRFSATPEIKFMSWKEWLRAGSGQSIPMRSHSAIDVLIEEYQERERFNSSSSLQPRIHKDTTASESRQNLDSLPSRIRINSIPAQRILGSILDGEDHWRRREEPVVILRPFKILSGHSAEIKAKMVEIEQILAERRKEQEKSETAADEVPEPTNDIKGAPSHGDVSCQGFHDADSAIENVNDIKGTPSHDEVSCQRDQDTCSAIENANEDDISNTDTQSQTQSIYYPVGFFEGTNWAEVNLSAIEEAANDFRCVVDFINKILQPVQSYLQNEPSSVNFNNIWHLFTTGSLVYIKDRSTPQKVWKVIQAIGGRRYLREPRTSITDWETKWSPFVIDCYYLDFDGTNFMRVYRQFTIEMFDGSMPIAGLQIMPLAVAERSLSGIERDEFRRRGEQFLTYLKPQFRYYQGTTLTQSPCGDPLFTQEEGEYGPRRLFTEQVRSQVVVDFERGIQANPDWAPPSSEVDLWKVSVDEFEDDFETQDIRTENLWDSRVSEEFLNREEFKRQRWNKGEEMPEGDDLLLLPARVFGYILRTRSWGMSTLSSTEKIMS
jgi:hypothetical protein